MLEGVPLDRRRLLRLHLEGFTTQEIAELNGWTEPKARNLLYRTLGDLREKLRARESSMKATEKRKGPAP